MKIVLYIVTLFLTATGLTAEKIDVDDFTGLMGGRTEHWRHVGEPEDIKTLEFARALYEKNKDKQFSPSTQVKIPHVVHFIWLGPKPFPPQSVENIRTWIARNPDWKIKFWTDRDREPPCSGIEMARVQDFEFTQLGRCYEESNNWGEKSDLLRYEILFQEGGVYADHDANCLKTFDGLHGAYDFYCCLETPHTPFVGKNITCGNGVIGSRAGHPTIAEVIHWINKHWDAIGYAYRGKDDYSRIEIVMQRTYIALTHAISSTVDLPGNTDIVLPAAYFFAKSGIPSIYSKHFYATAWDDFRIRRSEGDKIVERHLNKLQKKTTYLFWGFGAVLGGMGIALVCSLKNFKRSQNS